MNRMIQTYVCASLHKVHTTYRYLFDREKESLMPVNSMGMSYPANSAIFAPAAT